MRLKAEFDYTAVLDVEIPHALNVPHSEVVDVLGGWRLKNGAEYLLIKLDDVPGPSVYARTSPSAIWFGWSYLGSRALWVQDALKLAPGKKEKIRRRVVTRMTDDELRALEPIMMTKDTSEI